MRTLLFVIRHGFPGRPEIARAVAETEHLEFKLNALRGRKFALIFVQSPPAHVISRYAQRMRPPRQDWYVIGEGWLSEV